MESIAPDSPVRGPLIFLRRGSDRLLEGGGLLVHRLVRFVFRFECARIRAVVGLRFGSMSDFGVRC